MIWPIYAASLGFVFVALNIRTLWIRRRLSISVGDGGSQQMLRAIRVHANFSEYAPLALILIFAAEAHAAAVSLSAANSKVCTLARLG